MLYKDGTMEVDEEYLNKFCFFVGEALQKKEKIIVVVGGGARAKQYAERARAETKSEFFADREAIKATRENAELVIKQLGPKAFQEVIKTPDEATEAISSGKVGVSGGFLEGITTDACAVIIAERVGASQVINVSSIDGVYDSDPRKNPSAKKFSEMTHGQLVELATRSDDRLARTNFVFDLVACKLAARSNIEIHFVNGHDLAQVEKAILGEKHGGTVVRN